MKTRRPRNKKRKLDSRTREVFNRAILNSLVGRTTLSESLRSGSDGIDPPGRDLDYECGYPSDPTIVTYRRLYEREEYAKRVVDVWPDECWSVRPELYETEDKKIMPFEKAWQELNKRINIWHYLHRLDKICGIGSFAILLLGFDDGADLSTPVAGINRKGEMSARKRQGKKSLNLLYVRPFAEDHVTIAKVEDDKANPRYGQPRWYDIQLSIPSYPEDGGNRGQEEMETVRVHWSRVIHVADNCESGGGVYGTPRMRAVLNRLLDIRKTLGGSAEMFWKGAFPGFSFETIPELLGESVMDETTIREQFEEYTEGLKRYLALDGATAKQLFPQVADPTQHVTQQVMAICACIGVPLRIFMGSESGHLASTQDSVNMNKRVGRRQQLFCETDLIRPLVDRLILVGCLPEPEEYFISWTDLNTMTDKDKALVSLQRAQALMQYVGGKVEAIMPVEKFFTLVIGFSPEETESIMEAIEENKTKLLTDPTGDKAAARDSELAIKQAKAAPKPVGATSSAPKPVGATSSARTKTQGGGRRGKPSRKPAGRPSGAIQRNRSSAFSRT